MTYLLVLYIMSENGSVSEHNLALFTNRADCRTTGAVMSGYYTATNKYGAEIKFSCDPIA